MLVIMKTSDNKTLYRNYSDFQHTDQKTAGKSPSSQMTYNEDKIKSRYQVKQSNSINLDRKLSGYDPDCADIVSECLSTKLAKSILNKLGDIDLVPNTDFVYKNNPDQLLMASQYLNDDKQTQKKHPVSGQPITDQLGNPIMESRVKGFTLDQLMENRFEEKSNGLTATKERHAKISVGGDPNNKDGQNLPLDTKFNINIAGKNESPILKEVSINKKEVYEGLKVSFLLGDHDVNPGNFYAMYDKQTDELRVGRIDFGHALNDLIKSMSPINRFAPKLESEGIVLDALNRDKVNGGVSKFQRDFKGVVSDPVFAEVMQTGYSNKQMSDMKQTIVEAMASLNDMHQNSNPKLKVEIEKSLISINKRLGNPVDLKGVSSSDKMSMLITTTIQNLDKMLEDNNKEIKSVGAMLKTQCLVAQVVKGEIAPETAAKEIKQLQQEHPELNGKREWVKTDLDSKAIKGTLEDYIKIEGEKIAKANGLEPYRANTFKDALLEEVKQDKNITKAGVNEKQKHDRKETPNAKANTEEVEKTAKSKQQETSVGTWKTVQVNNKEGVRGF